MNRLKKENIDKCLSLLKEFIEKSSEEDQKKGIAMLAIDQLSKINAGAETVGGPQCKGHPRADYVKHGGPQCKGHPRADYNK
jgi:hypothetical protein